MTEQMIRADGVELAAQSFGDPLRPPMLLIMGGMASMLWWPEALCERLANNGRYVIRYDSRDTGLSTKYPAGEPGYTFEDMVDDVFRVLDGYAIRAAHIVGMSLGAMIGQVAAIRQPSRVLSLTAISSSPIGMDTSHLPQFSEAFLARMDVAENADWSDRTQVIACMVEDSRVLAGTAHPFDEAQARAFIARDHDRSGGYLSATNHGALKLGDTWRGRLSDMKVPLLVIHGTADPVYPIEHGEALAGAVADARLLKLEGGGHELHPAHWETIAAAITGHTAQ
jgi:pimeloyl-ACP methyl ester carboxylesterase